MQGDTVHHGAHAELAHTVVDVVAALVGAHFLSRVAGVVTLRTIIAALCAIGLGILVVRRAEVSLLRLVPTTLVLLVLWAFASIFWSTDPFGSFARWTAMLAVAVLAVVPSPKSQA